MLTEKQKAILEENIYRMVKESIFENGYFENAYYEGGHKDMDNRSEPGSDKDDSGKRESVMKWLDSAQELHSVLSMYYIIEFPPNPLCLEVIKSFSEDHIGGKCKSEMARSV